MLIQSSVRLHLKEGVTQVVLQIHCRKGKGIMGLLDKFNDTNECTLKDIIM